MLSTDIKELGEKLSDTKSRIVGWEHFGAYVKENDARVRNVENICTAYETDRPKLVESHSLLQTQVNILEKVVSKDEFHNCMVEIKVHNEKMSESLDNINAKLKIFDVSFCTFKVLIKNRIFQGSLAVVIFIVISLLLNDINTTLGRIIDMGWWKP
jgi:hypothetical protein